MSKKIVIERRITIPISRRPHEMSAEDWRGVVNELNRLAVPNSAVGWSRETELIFTWEVPE